MITPQAIFSQTKDGLDIILRYYPQAEVGVKRKNAKFRIRSEQDDPSPSAILSHYNGIWRVTDFGSGEKAMDAIGIAMKEENCDFPTAIKLLCEQHGIIDEEGKVTAKLEPKIKQRPAKADEEEGTTFITKESFTVAELQTIFSRSIWSYLSRLKYVAGDEPGDELATRNAITICKKYRFFSLESYTIVKNRKATIISSTELFPIFLFNEGDWQKIYKPREREAQHRFFSIGKKPEHYVFGLEQCQRRLDDLQKNDTPGDSAEEEPENGSRETQLPEIIICTGGSDALNVAAMGYSVVWFNSETVDPKSIPFYKFRKMAERVYNLPDLDGTGRKKAHELALEHLDLFTAYLPDELGNRRDLKGKVCKDARDYFNYYSTEDFKNLLSMALPYRFWDEEPKRTRDGKIIKKFGRIQAEYKPNNRRLYNFLARSGFGKLPMPNTKDGEILIHLLGNVVHKIDYKHIRRYIEGFLESRHATEDLFNAFYRSDQVGNNSLENIKPVSLDFQDFGRDYQYLFFANEVWKVTADGIEVIKHEKCDRIVWADKVIPHRVKKLDPMFTIGLDEKTGLHTIDIQKKDCLFFRYLINTSRVYWKKELEEKLPEHSHQFQADYLANHQWSVDGPLLSEQERADQAQHLINKMASLGYLLHRYKDPATAYCVWAMDYNMQNSGQSYGGTGKSLAYDNLKRLIRQDYHNGRNDRLFDNQFIFARVTKHTDFLFFDDAYEYFNFKFLFSIITGSMDCVAKGVDGWVLSNEESPKICITSNFPPRDTDSATQRRLWFTTFSDYYHKNPNGEYKEERDPKSEFGKSLFTDFTPEEWNWCLNFYAQCIQVWLKFGKVDTPGETVKQNTYRNKMGASFHAWADVFFSEENGRLNAYVQKIYAHEVYKRDYDGKISPQLFKDKLRYWCLYNDYTLDPVELQNEKQKRIMVKVYKQEFRQGQWVKSDKQETVEHIYIQTPGVELTQAGLVRDGNGLSPIDPKEAIGF
ncbi:hypothetical protein GO755_22665 [Spirosoma sp. HMF4905]|uniref:Toprim domain-containing protein n=1 Tax=Spirosoma arboris TaxID=2682092 RepID=A0A7K1SGB7_9BACT|nr:hypothetical protein [Spirosoma arboris]MVM32860.1 hypothetical protein [Spirosoma arboris]